MSLNRERLDALCAETKQALSTLRALARKPNATAGQCKVKALSLKSRSEQIVQLLSEGK